MRQQARARRGAVRLSAILGLLAIGLAALNVYQYGAGRAAAAAPPAATATPPDAEARAPDAEARGPGPRRVIDAFARLFFQVMGTTVFKNRFLGIRTLQNPNDVWITQEIIVEVVPDFIIETGTHHGGSALLWAVILEEVNPQGRVITVDIEDMSEEARRVPVWGRRVEHLIGSSTAPEIVARIRERVAGARVLVILDSDHSRDHVLAELEAYAPLVNVGSYLIVQDSIVNGHPAMPEHGPGPYEAIEAFLERNDAFESDRTRERMLLTFNPKGYLRRVR